MKLLLILGPKGGAGKSTLARDLAAAALDGVHVVTIDSDAQGTLARWDERRAQAGVTPAIPCQAVPITRARDTLSGLGDAELIVTDTPTAIGEHPDAFKALIPAASLVVILSRPSVDDVDSVAGFMQVVQDLKRPGVCALNCVRPRVLEADGARRQLGRVGDVPATALPESVDVQRAMAGGQGVMEIRGRGPRTWLRSGTKSAAGWASTPRPPRRGAENDATARQQLLYREHRHRTNRASLALAEATVSLTTAADYASEIARLWVDAQRRFLEIGRQLNTAKAALPHGEFLPMVARDLPFGPSVAQRLMKVAEAVDAGVLPLRQVPQNYSIACELVVLSPEEREPAIEDGLLRPNVRRAEVTAFKRRVRGNPPPAAIDELRRLEAGRARIGARIAELRRQLGEKPSWTAPSIGTRDHIAAQNAPKFLN